MDTKGEVMRSQHRSLPAIPNVQKKQAPVTKKLLNAGDWLIKKSTSDRKLQKERNHDSNRKTLEENLRELNNRNSSKDKNRTNNGIYKMRQRDNNRNMEANKCHDLQTDTEDSGVSVPDILVSYAEDGDRLSVGNQSHSIFVCGHVDRDLWHRLLIDLSKHFSIRCTSVSDYPECNRWLPEMDCFLFLMDEISMNEFPYRDQLRVAVESNMNIVYVRDLGFELNVGQNLKVQSQNKQTQKRPRSCTQQVNLLHPNMSIQRLDMLSFESTIFDLKSNERQSRDICSPPLRRTKSELQDSGLYQLYTKSGVDMSELATDAYETAIVYHTLYHKRCFDQIISAINRQLTCLLDEPDSSSSRHSLLTPVSTFSLNSGFSGDSAVDDMYQTLTPEPPNVDDVIGHEDEPSFDDKTTASRKLSTPIETIFIVAPSTADKEPKIFHWPHDCEKESVSNSPSIDSLGFQDIDLSKKINDLDMFDAYQSD